MFEVQSHTVWPYMCMCCGLFAPTQSISNVVVSLTIHDNIIYICKRCSKKHETVVEGHKHIHVRIHVHFHTHIHIHIHVQVHVRVRVRVRVFVFVLAFCCCCRCGLLWLSCVVVVVVEEGEEGGDKPNHVTTDSLRSVPHDC